jgi:hypothetical protein
MIDGSLERYYVSGAVAQLEMRIGKLSQLIVLEKSQF